MPLCATNPSFVPLAFVFCAWYNLFVLMATPNRKPGSKVVSLKLSEVEYEQWREAAERQERSVSAVIRLAVRRYLKDAA